MAMTDERGRGGKLHPRLEYAALQGLCRAILEQAILDKAFLDEQHKDRARLCDCLIRREEIEDFERSEWRKWLRKRLTLTAVNTSDAIKRGQEAARRSVAIQKMWSGDKRKDKPNPAKYFYEYKGEMLTYYEIAKREGLTGGELQYRLRRGMTAEQAIQVARKFRANKNNKTI